MRKALIALLCVGMSLLTSGASVSSRGWAAVNSSETPQTVVSEPAVVPAEWFDVKVLVEGFPLEEYIARGRRYVEALEGAEYELRIRNPLGERVAVALSVDGLNTIDARRTTATNASKWVIGPYQTITIGGWQMNSERARHFYFTTERDSYGAKLGQTANLGVISAVFFRERRPIAIVAPPQPRPSGRDAERSKDSRAPESAQGSARAGAQPNRAEIYPPPDDESAATGIGRSVHHDVQWVNIDLYPHPVAEVQIRYEYRASLVRLGILPRPYPRPDVLHRRESATGFEDRQYCPEP